MPNVNMPNVNPDILGWARETAGLTIEGAARKLGVNDARGVAASARLAALESGDEHPTRAMLVKMAKHYRRPLLTFYLRDVPRKGDRGEDFRTLPESVGQTDAGWVDAVIRDIRARQSLVRASLEVAGEAQRLDFINSMTRSDGVADVVNSIKQTLDFDREAFRGKARLQDSFAYLRDITEAVGIFVILVDNLGSWHTPISVEAFRGFALADDIAPFVAVNANDSPGAWSFTLVHELAHLWTGATGVSGETAERERAVEKFCNDVAGEFLLPRDEIVGLEINEETPPGTAMEHITEFAQARNISRTMVAYRLHRAGAFSFERFQQFKEAYRQAFLKRKEAEKKRGTEKKGGPSYHVVRQHRAGTNLIRFVERMIHEGNLSTTKAGKVLGVGAHKVHALLAHGRPNHSI